MGAMIGADGVIALAAWAGAASTRVAWMGPKPTAGDGDGEPVAPGLARPGPFGRDDVASVVGGLAACGWPVGWGLIATAATGRQPAMGREGNGSEGAEGMGAPAGGADGSANAGDGDATRGADPKDGASAGIVKPAWITPGATVSGGAADDWAAAPGAFGDTASTGMTATELPWVCPARSSCAACGWATVVRLSFRAGAGFAAARGVTGSAPDEAMPGIASDVGITTESPGRAPEGLPALTD
jgi:hypothetical protein